jgi:hypothetical protein
MQAYLIDPHTKTCSTVNYSGNWKDIGPLLDCHLFDVVTTPEGFTLYVDDEGLYRDDQAFFLWKGIDQPLAGRALVMGPVDAEGDTTEITAPLIEIACKTVYGPLGILMAYCDLAEVDQ